MINHLDVSLNHIQKIGLIPYPIESDSLTDSSETESDSLTDSSETESDSLMGSDQVQAETIANEAPNIDGNNGISNSPMSAT